MNKKSLFGGALLAAGVVNGAANAQSFNLTYANINVGAYAYGVSGPSYDPFVGAGGWSVSASEPGAIATSVGNAGLIDMTAYSDANGGAFAAAFIVQFDVTANASATASWDFSGDFFGASAPFIIDDLTNAVNLLTVAPGTAAGSAGVSLVAGNSYQLTAFPFATGQGTGTSLANLVIPAPSSAALLGLGGLIATRRRR